MNASTAVFTTLICWIFQPRQSTSIELTASHARSILGPTTTYRCNVRRNTASKTVFVAAALHPILLVAKSIVLVQLCASKGFIPASPQNDALFGTYEENDSLCFTQSPNVESEIQSASVTLCVAARHFLGRENPSSRPVHVNCSTAHLVRRSESQRKQTYSPFRFCFLLFLPRRWLHFTLFVVGFGAAYGCT